MGQAGRRAMSSAAASVVGVADEGWAAGRGEEVGAEGVEATAATACEAVATARQAATAAWEAAKGEGTAGGRPA